MSVKISSLNTASTINSGDDINIAGNNPLAFSDWGGGWFMQDGTWIRSYNAKSLWMGAGYIGGDGGLTIGYGGAASPTGGAIIAGSVGIGTTSPNIYSISNATNIVSIQASGTNQGGILDIAATGTGFSGVNIGNDTIRRAFVGTVNGSSFGIYTNATNTGTGVTERLTITSAGNVGIGTSSPSSPGGFSRIVHISGDYASLVLTSTIPSKTWEIGVNSTSLLTFYDGVADRMVINTAGNVGIGTSSPTAPLTVAGTTDLAWDASTSKLQISRNSTVARLQNYENGSASTNLALQWEGGNVGIGTATPAYKLDVNGAIRMNSGYLNSNDYFEKVFEGAIVYPNGTANLAADVILGNISFWGYVEVEVNSTYNYQNSTGKLTKRFAVGTNQNNLIYTNESRVSDSIGTIPNNVAIGDFSWDATNSRYRIPISHIVSSGNTFSVKVRMFTGGAGAKSIFDTMSISSTYTLSSLSRQYPYYNDRLGIGTTSPTYNLHVNGGQFGTYLKGGDMGTGSDVVRMVKSDNSIAMLVRGDGNVGIGTSSPNNILHLYTNYAGSSNSGSAITITSDGSGGDNGWIGVNKGTGNGLTLGVENRDIIFQTDNTTAFNGTERMRITSGGSVGIGTVNPNTKLHTTGSLTVDDIIYLQRASSSLFLPIANYWNGSGSPLAGTKGDILAIGNAGGDGLVFVNSNIERMRIASGNLLIGTTTDAGYKLDVNGTARVQGAATFSSSITTTNGYISANYNAGDVITWGGIAPYANVYGALAWDVDKAIVKGRGGYALGLYVDNNVSKGITIATTGAATFSSLAGTGSRMVVADASGVLSTQTIPSGVSGSGTTDYLPKWTGASDLGDSIISEGSGIINVAGNVRTNNTNGILTLSNGNTSGGNKIQSWNTASNADGYLAFEGYTIEYGRFDASGQLGIGTTTPVTALDVVGGAYTNTTAKFGASMPIYIINDDPHVGFNTYYDSGWKYGAGSSSKFAGTLGCAQDTGDFTLRTSTSGGNAGNAVTLVALMTWKQNGYVGIGTTSPGAKLEVNSNSTLPVIRARYSSTYYTDYDSNGIDFRGSTQTFDIKDNGTVAIRIASGGNVGIGTTNPLALLSLSKSGLVDLQFNASDQATDEKNWVWQGGSSVGTGVYRLRAVNDAYSNGINALIFTRTGISSVTSAFTGGNVGIGTTAPEFLLDVAGGNARINGVMVGKGSNSVSTNLAVGVNPLYSNTSGSENTAIGYLTMYSTTTAIRNTALGNNALYSNTTGASNVAVGVGSLYSNTVGRYNSSVGYNSMQFMRGEYNSALGRDSMRGSLTAANNTGEYNTAVGYESMLLLTSGNWNTAVGNQAGTNLSTGSYNTFIGRSTVASAGGLVTTGSNNTIIGGYGGTTTLASTVVLADGAGQVQLWATGKNVALGTITPTTYANYTTLHIAGQTTTAGGVLRLTTSDSSIAVNIFTNNAGANYDTTTSHSHLFNINGASSLIVSSSGIETAGSITTEDPGLGAAAWKLGDVQNATVSLITSQYVEVVIGGSSYQLALVQLE